jgi:hypothetical protein
MTVTSGGNPATTVAAGSVVTLTATVKAGTTPVTFGLVSFCDATAAYCEDIHIIGTAQLTSAGTATLKLRLGIGSHSYKAVFAGTPNSSPAYAGSTSTAAALTVTGKYPTSTVITQGGGPGNYTLTATVTGSSSAPAPTGTIYFLDTTYGDSVLGTATLNAGTAGLFFLFPPGLAAGAGPQALTEGDFNGDGIPDLALANNQNETVSIELGNGDGTFVQAANSPVSVGVLPISIAVGDFNGDGKQDLAVLSAIQSLTILLGNGDGTFTQSAGSPITFPNSDPVFVAVGDFNGDGKADLVLASSDTYSLIILLGNGDGTFTSAASSPLTVGQSGDAFEFVTVGDLNGDGVPDLAVLSSVTNSSGDSQPGTVTILLGNGNGTFTQAANSPVTVGYAPQAAVVGDFSGDGKLDLAITNVCGSDAADNIPSCTDSTTAGTMTILMGNGNGTFTQATNSPVSLGHDPQSIAVGDFNRDGKADLAVVNTLDGTVWVFPGNGDGTFSTESNVIVDSDTASPYGIAVGDFNGDGISDFATANYQSNSATVVLSQLSESTATAVIAVPGNDVVDASYPGDTNFAASVSGETALTAIPPTPVISPASGTITSGKYITITDPAPGATIYYSESGDAAYTGVVQYTGPIPMEGSGTLNIQAYVTENGHQSENASAAYILNFPSAVATPVISLASGSYATAQTFTISDTTPGATIYYSTDGSPYQNSVYSGPVTVSASEVVTAFAIAPGYADSAYAVAQYYIASSMSRFIYTIAGSGTPGYDGDGGPATFAELTSANGVAIDSFANVYMADGTNNVVRKVNANTGIITTIAGTGVAGHLGDGGPATRAELWSPTSVAVDPTGNIFIGETGDSVVRRIDAVTGVITTYAGNPTGTGGLGGPASNFTLGNIVGIACDYLGNLYIAESGEVLRVNAASGDITEIIGNIPGISFYLLNGIAVDHTQNIYISDWIDAAVWKINPQGSVSLFAGDNQGFYSGDGGPATAAVLSYLSGLAVDGSGNVYIADSNFYVIREVNTSGIINTIAGSIYGYNSLGGDGSPATDAALDFPQNIAADPTGNVYLADGSYRIREITVPSAPPTAVAATPVLSLAAGSYPGSQILTMTDATLGAEIYVSLNGVAPTTSSQGYHGPIEITGTVTVQAIAEAPGYLTSAPVSATYTITTPPTVAISTIAGNGTYGFSGFGGPATSANLGETPAIAFDGKGNLYIADQSNAVVWMVAAATRDISVVAGTGTAGNGADGGQATATEINGSSSVAIDKLGNLYISDSGRIRKVAAATGIITTVAGPGVYTTLGDGGPATSAYLGSTVGLAFDSAGNLYITDNANNFGSRVRMVAATTGIITTVAGVGTQGPLGDGGLATAAYLSNPGGVSFDSFGNLYITDIGNSRIRKVDATTGIITTIAGTGIPGNTGDGGLATAAKVSFVPQGTGIALDGAGNIYFTNYPDTLRKVDATTGIITTIAGDGYYGYGGDGGAATMAELDYPAGIALDSAGNIDIADTFNCAVRKVSFTGPVPAPVFTPAAGTYTSVQTVSITDSVNGATFYYTTDGTTPTPASNVSSGSVTVGATETLKAIAVATGYAESPVTSAAYTINILATPTITWATPTPIAYGTPLSAAQLDATSSVPGSYVYTPPAGTILGAGSQTLKTTLTPTDGKDYTTATATVMLTVNKAATTTKVVPSINPSALSQSVTFAATVTAAYGTPTGTVTFLSNGTSIGTGTLAGGVATLSTSALPLGTNSITATFGGSADYNASTAPALSEVTNAAAVVTLTSPTPGSVLGTTNVVFSWTLVAGATEYDLYLGTTGVGSANLYNSAGVTTTSVTVPTVPSKGVTVYARLYYQIKGAWQYTDYTYTESPVPPALTTPTPGSVLGTTNVVFSWTPGAGVSEYDLYLGTTAVGSDNLYNSAGVTTTSVTVPTLPSKGATVYARLYYQIKGVWQSIDYTYTESQSVPPVLTSPTPGSVLGTANVVFTWTPGAGVTEYDLYLGTTGVGSMNLYNSAGVTTTSVTVPKIPPTGATVYARLYYQIKGAWQYTDYTYTEQ